MNSRSSVALLLVALTLTGCSVEIQTVPAAHSETAEPYDVDHFEIIAAHILTLNDGMRWAAELADDTSPDELRVGASKIDALVPRDKIWFATGNKISREIASLNAATFDGTSSTANIAEMKRIAIEIQTAIAHGDKP